MSKLTRLRRSKMNWRKGKSKLEIVVIIIAAFLIALNQGFAVIDCNKAGKGYEEGSGGSSITQMSSIEDFIVLGGGYSLKANSHVQELLKMVELKDVGGGNFEEMGGVVDMALENMINAIETYEALITRAEATPYKNDVIVQLKEFEYDDFRMTYKLNRPIFNTVEDYLRKGNITGVFKYKQSGFLDILVLLTKIKCEIERSKLPNLELFWDLNETFAELSMFGSYVARIFHAIN
jgi:hypothetical protein